MASIVISDLRPAGFDLFMDSENFLSELSDGELSVISGGGFSFFCSSQFCVITVASILTALKINGAMRYRGHSYKM